MAFSFSSPAPQQQLFPQGSPFASATQQQQQSQFQFQPQPQQQLQFQPQPQQQQFQFQQQQAAMAAQQQLLLYTADRSPAGYNTKWEDLHPDSQKFLLQIEQRIREYKDESERLDLCSRLYDSSVSNDSFELDASRIIQELGGTTTAMEREKVSIQGLASTVNDMMWSTEFAIRSYMMLRPRFVRPNIGTTTSSASPIGTAVASSHPSQLTVAPTFDFYNGFPKRPSPFMQHTAARFEKYLGECCKWIEELEQLVQMDTNKRSLDSLEALPKVLSNVHDYFVHVASKVESLHQYIESMKTAYLNNQRRRGDGNDPFLEANRREVAKQEAASRRVHPTLHLPATPQPTTQIAGAFPNSATSVPTPPQPSSGPSAATAGSGLSLFSTPSPAATSSFLFSTPTPSAPSSTLFGSSGFSPQSTPFGTASTSLFGSSQTPSGFGTSTPSFASTPAMGSSPLFSTPSLGAGIATGSGSSFGGASKSSRPKSRTTRR
ncbi:nuclear pore complex protein NUP58 [Typha angustifolia]|uniref:nuclear pore complex protein NUP58 n=1 Tax=Typha angustifolia TaxID=59011 RepID=UPI003C30498A